VATLGTHDMFPFAGFAAGADISARVQTGQLGAEGARRECAARRKLIARLERWLPPTGSEDRAGAPGRASAPGEVAPGGGTGAGHAAGAGEVAPASGALAEELLRRAVAYLAGTPAALMVVGVEDLLLETRPQNLPGTGAEWPNWRRRLAGTQADVTKAVALIAATCEAAIHSPALREPPSGTPGSGEAAKGIPARFRG
jgi:4-alpha-glucanotransferase